MSRRGLIVSIALAAVAAAGVNAVVVGAQADGAREARQGLDRQQDRSRAPASPGVIEQGLRLVVGGYGRGPAGGYRKRPRGSHKQNRRQLLAKHRRG